jgi:hypothetical protein
MLQHKAIDVPTKTDILKSGHTTAEFFAAEEHNAKKNVQPGLEPSVLAKEAAIQGNLNGGFHFGPRSGGLNAKA